MPDRANGSPQPMGEGGPISFRPMPGPCPKVLLSIGGEPSTPVAPAKRLTPTAPPQSATGRRPPTYPVVHQASDAAWQRHHAGWPVATALEAMASIV